MKRRTRTGAQRRAIGEAHGWICYLTGAKIDPVRDRWEIEHVIPLAGGGTDDDENCRPVLASAHLEKTKADVARIAKGKRIADKHFGSKARKSRPMPGTKASGWKHKMDRSWERR